MEHWKQTLLQYARQWENGIELELEKMQILESGSKVKQKGHRYRAVRSYEEVSSRLLTDLVAKVFRGSREQLFVRLFDGRKLSAKERALLEALLKEGS